jgi:hypothetical protein
LQSLLTYVLRPSYSYSNGAFTTVVNLSNINRLTANTVTYQVLYVGDSSNNVYVGSNSGNAAVYATACNSTCNVGLGLLAGNGVSNSSLSEFIGYYCGVGTCNIVGSIVMGAYAGYDGSNISNSVLIGTSNSTLTLTQGLNGISNTISIGGNAGGIGNSNLYVGTSTGCNMTGSGNIFIGHGIYLANIPSYTYLPTTSGYVTNTYSASSSSNLFIGRGASNMLISGNLANGLVSIGTTDTSSYSVAGFGAINTATWGGTITSPAGSGYGFLALDVGGWTRIRTGLTIATDPYAPLGNGNVSNAKYELDVNGHIRVSDGYGVLTYSNVYGGVSSNVSLTLSNISNVGNTTVNIGTGSSVGLLNVNGQVTAGLVQTTGCYTVRGTTTITSSGTITPYTMTAPGLVQVTVIDTVTSNYYVSASVVSTKLPANSGGTPNTFVGNVLGGANLTVSVAASVVTITNGIASDRTISYNITVFPTP